MKRALSLLLCLSLLCVLVGCSTQPEGPTIIAKDGDTLGEGATSLAVTITDDKGESITVTVKTDKTIVGEALQDVKLISGEMGDYGLYIKVVNGVTADYDVNGAYWAFYINGEYAMSGVDTTDITAGAAYELRYEK